jgi:hypothetical protein
VIEKKPGVHSGLAPEFCEGDVRVFVFVNPRGHEPPIAGCGIQGVDQISIGLQDLAISHRLTGGLCGKKRCHVRRLDTGVER